MTNEEFVDRRRLLVPGCICPKCKKPGRSKGTRYFKSDGKTPLDHPYRRFHCRFCDHNWKDFDSVANLATSAYPANQRD